jgi:hypothetical protein
MECLAVDSIDLWYAQNVRYNYATGTSSSTSTAFTQMVWRSTTQFAFGVALSSDKRTVYVIAHHFPAGNANGQFLKNVPSKCPATTTVRAG